jgi:hypothetical protein
MKYELGTYTVNTQKYTSLIGAVLDAQKTLSDISWDFFSDDFKSVNWLIEPDLPLDALYRLRAQQIRDRYDYVVVMVSGGADSTNVVRTFLNNNIHVDEVVATAPISGLNNWNWDDKNTMVHNSISETNFAQIPLLQEISNMHPNVKVSLIDSFNELIKTSSGKWIYEESINWVHPFTNARAKLNSLKHLVDLAEQGKTIGIVYGSDKPLLRYDTYGNLYSTISNMTFDYLNNPFNKEYDNVDRVMFYHARDLPEVLVKMSHCVAKFIHKKENLFLTNALGLNVPMWDFEKKFGKKMEIDIDYQREISHVLYPTTYKKVFQCRKFKVAESFSVPQHGWFDILHKDTYIYQMYKSDSSLFYKDINPKYLTDDKRSFKRFNQFYKLGHYTQFLSQT